MPERIRPSAAPFIMGAILVVIDQITKFVVLKTIPVGARAFSAFGDFFWLVHHKNLGAAFSMGDGMPAFLRVLILIVLPLGLLAGLVVYYFRTNEFTKLQRWAVGLIVAGGLGNQIDRIFRPDGVIDFLSVKFYGLFGLERWPTFNVADSCIFIGGILFVVAGLFAPRHQPTAE